jgi:hypothetical protein
MFPGEFPGFIGTQGAEIFSIRSAFCVRWYRPDFSVQLFLNNRQRHYKNTACVYRHRITCPAVIMHVLDE